MDQDRDFKFQQSHWEMMLSWMESHPILLRTNFTRRRGDNKNYKAQWNKLASALNALGYGIKTCDKWQKAFAGWKTKTICKAAKFAREQRRTGGGPSNAVPLTDMEQRLMSVIGTKYAVGDDIGEIGVHPLPISMNDSNEEGAIRRKDFDLVLPSCSKTTTPKKSPPTLRPLDNSGDMETPLIRKRKSSSCQKPPPKKIKPSNQKNGTKSVVEIYSENQAKLLAQVETLAKIAGKMAESLSAVETIAKNTEKIAESLSAFFQWFKERKEDRLARR